MSFDIFAILNGDISSKSHLIPNREENAITGSVFVHENLELAGKPRESNVLHECLNGNIPNFLRNFVPITVSNGTNSIVYLVMPDVLSIGSDDDFCRMPMDPHTAQSIATKYGCTLPTTKMVNDIWKHSTNRLAPHAIPPDNDMAKTYRINMHNDIINQQLKDQQMNSRTLTSGHKKDVVLTNQLSPNNPNKRVAIYGWIQLNGAAIQPLNAVSHADFYADYSHGIRLVANECLVNGYAMTIQDVFAHPVYSALISNEGPLTFLAY